MPEAPVTVASPPMMDLVTTAIQEVIVHREHTMVVEDEPALVEVVDSIDIAEQLEGENNAKPHGKYSC